MEQAVGAALHISIANAGDPEKLSALLKAALAAQDRPAIEVVPRGYRCAECWRDDGGHESGCAMVMSGLVEAN